MSGERTDDYFDRLVDLDALGAYLAAELGPETDLAVEHHQEGHSNETLFVVWGERDLVLRRPAAGETAEKAHDVLREYRVMDALQDTAVPVPPTVLACDDHGVIGSDFYLMERVDGHVLRYDEPDRFANRADREAIGDRLIRTLAAIHAVDYDAVGLREFGHPPGYTERQVGIWTKQLDWAFEVTATEREIPTLDTVGAWLEDHCPDSHPHTLVHGDYKPDNVMLDPGDRPEVAAVFDWELSTLGDPRADLGWFCIYWRDPKDPPPAVPELTARWMERAGYPSRRTLVSQYEEATGIEFTGERFYRTLGVYKLAALGEMFYRRYLEGNSDDPMYPHMEERVPGLADRAMRIIEGEEPL